MRYLIVFMLFMILGCTTRSTDEIGKASVFFPEEVYLDGGAVWKYYVQTTREEGQRKTDISYRKVILDGSQLVLTDYRADFLESYEEHLQIEDNVWKVKSTKSYDYYTNLDSLRTTNNYSLTDKNIFLDWENQSSELHRIIETDRWYNDIIETQTSNIDSVDNDASIKVFDGSMELVFIMDADTTNNQVKWKRVFTQGLGMTERSLKMDGFTKLWELDEIISLKEFEKRKNHGTHRVAYIDPDNTLSDDTDFETCFHISKINDYYNDDRAQHKGGKGGLWEMLEGKLNKELLQNQEGYLSYHFVVNCKGEAGRFTTEEADLDYNKYKFSDELRNHLLNMLIEEDQWKNLTINGEPRDAYVYVTFKIKDDEIIEILP